MKEKGNKKAVGGEKQNKSSLEAGRAEWVRQGQRGESAQINITITFFPCLQHFYFFGENSNLQVRKLILKPYFVFKDICFSKEFFLVRNAYFYGNQIHFESWECHHLKGACNIANMKYVLVLFYSEFWIFPSQFHPVILNSVFRHGSYKQSTVIHFHVLGSDVYFYLIIEHFYSQQSRHSLYKNEFWFKY